MQNLKPQGTQRTRRVPGISDPETILEKIKTPTEQDLQKTLPQESDRHESGRHLRWSNQSCIRSTM